MTEEFPQDLHALDDHADAAFRANLQCPSYARERHPTAHDAAHAALATAGGVRVQFTQPQPRKTALVELRDRHVNYTASVPLTDVPAAWHAGLRAYATRHEGRCYDQSALGYFLVPDWYLFLSDATAEESLPAWRRLDAAESYPHTKWRDTGLGLLSDYLDTLQALRFLACVLPQGTLGLHRLAIFMPRASS